MPCHDVALMLDGGNMGYEELGLSLLTVLVMTWVVMEWPK
jgi:hypothetical protein